MNLETEENYELVSKKPALSVGTIVLGLALISIPIIITLFITIPQLAQSLVQAKGEIIKGILIGATTLPVLLFVTIKGGKMWYKQWWNWVAIGITCVALITITFISTFGGQSQDMNGGMYPEGDMNIEGTMPEGMDMGGEMNMSDDVIIMN